MDLQHTTEKTHSFDPPADHLTPSARDDLVYTTVTAPGSCSLGSSAILHRSKDETSTLAKDIFYIFCFPSTSSR